MECENIIQVKAYKAQDSFTYMNQTLTAIKILKVTYVTVNKNTKIDCCSHETIIIYYMFQSKTIENTEKLNVTIEHNSDDVSI